METSTIAHKLISRFTAEGIQVNKVSQNQDAGNLEITLQAKDLGLKSLTIKVEAAEVSRPLAEDFTLLGPDEGYVDHVDYVQEDAGELVLAADDKM